MANDQTAAQLQTLRRFVDTQTQQMKEAPGVLADVLEEVKRLSERRFAQYHRPGDGALDNVKRIADFACLSLREAVSIFILKHLGVLSDPNTKATDFRERAQDIILYTALLIASGELD
jgi:hypothetical protein